MADTVTREQLQEALRERHTPEVQERLDHARIAVAGLGGLGSHVASALARIGVGHLHLIDYDVVDITNLNRQQYTARHLGRYKTDALADALKEINPYLDIYTDCVKVTEDNLVSLFDRETIICEAFDRPQAKAAGQRHTGPFPRQISGGRIRHGRLWQQQCRDYQESREPLLPLRGRHLGS